MPQSASSQESSLLLTLEEISQLVSHSHHPGETLANIVRLIQGRFRTDVCSVYVLDAEQGELVLGATIGLKPESVGRIHMHLNEGLTGLVAERTAPVMVDDAFAHPRFKFFPEAGEEPYHSFLGVPLVEGGTLQGVLVVQTREPRIFSPNETRMLVTVGAQVAPLVSEARLIEQVVAAAHEARTDEAGVSERGAPISMRGTPLSPGAGLGHAYLIDAFEDWQLTPEKRNCDFATEQGRLVAAMDAARQEITELSQRISTLVGEEHGAILQGQLMILQDGTIEEDLTACLAAGHSAEGALLQTLNKYIGAFHKLTNAVFQERVYDVKDVFRRMLWHLRPRSPAAESAPEKLVLVAHEASVMDLFSVDLDRLAGVIVEHGGPQSHAAILARSLSIPMVGQVPELVSRIKSGQKLSVDGSTGLICINPAPAAMSQTMPLSASAAVEPAVPELPISGLPRVEANINLLREVAPAISQGMSGVGLYRSEFLFLARRSLPTEEEQVGIYRKLLAALQGRPASIRTFDLRPDKLAHYSYLTSSITRPLDWRLVLDSAPLQKLFKDQVRAILRAGAIGPARILIPLVTRTELLDFVMETLGQSRDELRHEGLECAPYVPIGIMLEVTAAIAMIEDWADRADFFALGTNDLFASALGVDRGDPVGPAGSDPLHPGFLRLLREAVESAHHAGRSITVCGEMASDSEGLVALAALGVDSVSVAVPQLRAVGKKLAGLSAEKLANSAAQLFDLRCTAQVRNFLRELANAF
jgi:phosphotransferase system enzyme I (PtsP)